jgi:hypothetical protein
MPRTRSLRRCPSWSTRRQTIDGLIEEGDEIAGEVADKDVLDAAIVGAAQSVEHYEIVASPSGPNCSGGRLSSRASQANSMSTREFNCRGLPERDGPRA